MSSPDPLSLSPGWSTIEIGGRPADLFVPRDEPKQAALYLHGYTGETLRGNAVFTAEVERHRLLTVCPHGGKSWWLDVPTPEFPEQAPLAFLHERVIPWIEANTRFRTPNIGVFGIGMGGQGAIGLAYRFGRQYPVVAAISPAIDFHLLHGRGTILDQLFTSTEETRQHTPILHLHPLNWPEHQLFCCDPRDPQWLTGCERLASKLSSSGIPYESDFQTRAGATGWGWDYFEAQAAKVVEFIAERSERVLPVAPQTKPVSGE